ncbi:MAG: nickel pincer cofactor biosynthesis protein LarB [Elusimicrobia bacterium]|jgi:NCAIR mutase (PurE)-related protein|nr:nickel pincer cofactor biosynthesis protein LarB [Elusimicrobiota bacterium]
MNIDKLRETVRSIKDGSLSAEEGVEKLKGLPYENIDFARLDHHRALRKGFPEVVYAKGKTPEQLIKIIKKMSAKNPAVLITRLSYEKYKKLKEDIPKHLYEEEASSLVIGKYPSLNNFPAVPVITAGTSDISVAKEAGAILKATGNKVREIYDVGVSGVHRFLDVVETTRNSRVVIVIAGMDGVLPSVAGGLLSQPVIAVPTSTGYGANFDGLAPLLTMLNSCAPGVVTVNIDNGFGAGFAAAMINAL